MTPDDTTPADPKQPRHPQTHGDFAAGERTSDADEMGSDFAAGERGSEADETGSDYAAGERKLPRDPEEESDFARGQDKK